jgi:hypothetical protein
MKENKRDDDHANYRPEVEQLGRKDSCKSKSNGWSAWLARGRLISNEKELRHKCKHCNRKSKYDRRAIESLMPTTITMYQCPLLQGELLETINLGMNATRA